MNENAEEDIPDFEEMMEKWWEEFRDEHWEDYSAELVSLRLLLEKTFGASKGVKDIDQMIRLVNVISNASTQVAQILKMRKNQEKELREDFQRQVDRVVDQALAELAEELEYNKEPAPPQLPDGMDEDEDDIEHMREVLGQVKAERLTTKSTKGTKKRY